MTIAGYRGPALHDQPYNPSLLVLRRGLLHVHTQYLCLGIHTHTPYTCVFSFVNNILTVPPLMRTVPLFFKILIFDFTYLMAENNHRVRIAWSKEEEAALCRGMSEHNSSGNVWSKVP